MAETGRSMLAIGRVTRPHGLHGDVRVAVETDFPERVQPGVTVGIGRDGRERDLVVHTLRWHKDSWLMSFEGLTTCDEVAALSGFSLFLPEQDRAALPSTYFYEHELIGCACVDVAGAALGRVTALIPGGTGHLIEVQTGEKAVLIPFVSPIIVRVEAEARRIVLDPPLGLIDEDDAL